MKKYCLKKTTAIIAMTGMLISICTGCTKKVEDMEYKFDWKTTTDTYELDGKYSGTVSDNVPNGDGTFEVGKKNKDGYFYYKGEWSNGKPKGDGKVTDMEYKFDWEGTDKTYKFDGKYSGTVLNGIPNGNGTYEAGKKNKDGYFCYEGKWSNGKPEGDGTLNRVNDYGEKYTYKGGFRNGLFDGHGEQIYDKDSYYKVIGNFHEGEFKPSLVELVTVHGTKKDDCEYTLSDTETEFLNKNEKMFTVKDRKEKKAEIKKAKNFNAKEFKKDPSEFKPKIVKASNLNVVQIQSYAGYYEKKESFLILADSDYDNYYYVYYNGDAKGILENNNVDMYFLPIDYSTYKTIADTENYAIVGQAALLEKK